MNTHASMNRIYRLVWSDARGAWTPVAETARGRGKSNGRAAKLLAPVLATLALATGMSAHAASPVGMAPAPHELPSGGQVVAGRPRSSPPAPQTLRCWTSIKVHSGAIIDWQTFNVGSAAQVNFNQPNSEAATLNRVLDSNPSQIFGKITATGQVSLPIEWCVFRQECLGRCGRADRDHQHDFC